MKSLKGTIFFFFVLLLLAVQGVFLHIIYNAIRQQEENQVQYRLGTARTVFEAQFASRRESLAAFADTAARDFGLKQVFEEDTRSFLVALNNHRQRIDADIALAVAPDGTILAQLLTQDDGEGGRTRLGPEQGEPFPYPEWLELTEAARLYPLQGNVYQLSLAPLSSGAVVIGWIGFGYAIDAGLAAYFSGLTELDTDFALRDGTGWSLLASSRGPLDGDALRESNALLPALLDGSPSSERIATRLDLGRVDGRGLAVVMHGDRSGLLAQIAERWWELGLLALLTLSLSLGGAFVIATRISRPVQALVRQARQIAGGSYDLDFQVDSQGELRELADEFRHMQEAVRAREQLISHHAYHDDLSGLPNRKRLAQVLAREPGRRGGSLSKIGIQRINEINSTLGHDVGDEVIRTVTERLARLCGPDQLFHLGGSEFVVLHPDSRAEQVEGFLYALRRVMEVKFQYQGISLYLELQAGSVLCPADGPLSGIQLQQAAVALQHAQKTGQAWQLYHPALSSDTMQHLQLINDLKSAIEQGQLVLHYQPQLDLLRGRVEQVEALVRWRHPEHGMIPPDKFIGIAEQTGLINPLTLWVLDEALRQHKQWVKEGIWLSIAVNISAHNLKDAQFQKRVQQAIQDGGLARGAFSLEMTERAMVTDLDNALDVLGRFRDGGIALSIDDYGTGYSSLAQLRQLPVSELKVDRSFIQKLEEQPDSQIIVSSTIELAHKLGLRVVAEGIEDDGALRWLRDVGCDMGQGFHICRPKPAPELTHWLRHSDWCPRPAARVHQLS